MPDRSLNLVQPSWSNSYLSVQKILSKFIYSDNLKNRTSALTCNDAGAEAVDEDLKDCQPWDRLALLHRLKTFRPGTWFGKPTRLSAIVCASHGWTNSSMDTLECPSCGAVLAFTTSDTLLGHDADEAVDEFLRDLAQTHTSYCIWHGHPPTSHDLIAFPAAQVQLVCEALVGRIAELAQLEALPYLGGGGMAVMTDRCLIQLLAFLDTAVVPIMAPTNRASDSNQAAEDKHGERLHLTMLSRRPCAFSLANKVIAALGWRLKPLSGCSASSDGLFAMADCMLSCPTCSAAVGLWSLTVAPETEGALGCCGLLGSWGAGSSVRGNSLKSMSIAGGVEGDTNPWLPSKTVAFGSAASSGPPSPVGAADSAYASVPLGSTVPAFGGSVSGAAFGSSVCLSANALSSAKPPGVSAAGVGRDGRKRGRTSSGATGTRQTAVKAARIMAEMFDENLKEDVAARLRSAGLALSNDESAFDPVMSHRAWCPWVFSDSSAGWRLLLNAAAPVDLLPAVEREPSQTSAPFVPAPSHVDNGPRHIYRRSGSGGRHARRQTIVSAAHDLVDRLSRRHIVAPSPPPADGKSGS